MNKRLFFLDFIRVISMILIILFHYKGALAIYNIQYDFNFFTSFRNATYGNIGVVLFFMVSGASLMHTYNSKLEIKNYLKKRFLSIYPLFWTSYICVFLTLFLLSKSVNHVASNWTFIFTVLGVDGYLYHTIYNFYLIGEWFLGSIIIIYLLFPAIRLCVKKYPKISFIIFTVIYFFLVRYYNFNISIEANAFVRVYDFILGMYFIEYVKEVRLKGVVICGIVAYFFMMTEWSIPHTYCVTIAGVCLYYICIYCSKLVKKSYYSVYTILSKYSFAVFLVHHVIIVQIVKLFKDLTLSFFEVMALLMINCVFIGIASKYTFGLSNRIVGFIRQTRELNKQEEHV